MAGDWIPWSKGLTRKPEVIAIASTVARDRRWVASVMMELWEWADSESTDGFIPAVAEAALLTALIPDTSAEFWAAVESVGWLRFRNGGLEIPHFERWMGQSAKRRLQDSRRKRDVRKMSASDADKNRSPVLFSPLTDPPRAVGGCGGSEKPPTEINARPALNRPTNGASWEVFLAGEWVLHHHGTARTEKDTDRLAEFFGELLRQGVPADSLLAEIRRGDRDRTEPTWVFKARLMPGQGKDLFAGAREFARKHGMG
jgi:hypothetical protein